MTTAYCVEKSKYLNLFANPANGTNEGQRSGQQEELRTTPLVGLRAKCQADAQSSKASLFPQYGLLGIHTGGHSHIPNKEPVLMNTNAPNSYFICGSQGSGKSYTLSCMLENCLLRDDRIGKLASPMAGVVFHYENDGGKSLAEAASLCSTGVKVRALVSRSYWRELKPLYKAIPGAQKNLTVEPLMFEDKHLTVARLQKLMAFSESDNAMPLYMEVLVRILRETAIKGTQLSLAELQRKLDAEEFNTSQRTMLNMRLDLLQSFSASSARHELVEDMLRARKPAAKTALAQSMAPVPQTDVFALPPGTLTIIDLSDPLVTAPAACGLFDICLSLMIENKPSSGLIVALDEAHKYLNQSSAAVDFTEHVLQTIRLQRHNGTRIIVSTQEPTISGNLLDLCSVSIVHRFTSPAWFATIKEHLGGASDLTPSVREQKEMFERIVELPVGESLVFSPASYVCTEGDTAMKLGAGVMRMKTRRRIGTDRGQSELSHR